MIITNNEELQLYLAKIQKCKYIAIDTEFVRINTYYPTLSLIQIATDKELFAIDVTVDNLDYTLLLEILTSSDTVKVFHAAGQDVEALYNMFNIIPQPIFDTQIAFHFMHEEVVGYDKLILEYLEHEINKSSQFSNWLKRPLSPKQIKYALDDVLYLYKVYPLMLERLEESEELEWVKEDSNYYHEDDYTFSPEKIYRKIVNYLVTPEEQLLAWHLIALREEIARLDNVPRNKIFDNESLVQIINTKKHLPHLSAQHNQKIQDLLSSKYLKNNTEIDKATKLNNDFKAKYKNRIAALQQLVSKVSDEYQLPPELIASASELKKFVSGQKNKIEKGWRQQIFGQFATQVHNMSDLQKL